MYFSFIYFSIFFEINIFITVNEKFLIQFLSQVLNLYESPAGFGLSLLRCISWCVFMISTAATIRKYPEKSTFYYPFGLLSSCWILGGPFLTLIGIGMLDAWVRESVMYLTFSMLAFMGHTTFLVRSIRYFKSFCSYF